METSDQNMRVGAVLTFYQTARLLLAKLGVSILSDTKIIIQNLDFYRMQGSYVREVTESRTENKSETLEEQRLCCYGGFLGRATVRSSPESNIAIIVVNPHDFPQCNIFWFSSESLDTCLNSFTNQTTNASFNMHTFFSSLTIQPFDTKRILRCSQNRCTMYGRNWDLYNYNVPVTLRT